MSQDIKTLTESWRASAADQRDRIRGLEQSLLTATAQFGSLPRWEALSRLEFTLDSVRMLCTTYREFVIHHYSWIANSHPLLPG